MSNLNKPPKFSRTERRQVGLKIFKLIDEKAQQKAQSDKYQAEVAKMKSTPEYKQFEIRQRILQKLDKANKNADENTKHNNMLEFAKTTIETIKQEYNNLTAEQQQNIIYIIEIAKGFATHIKVLNAYANEDLVANFTQQVEQINPEFIELFNLETIVLMSL